MKDNGFVFDVSPIDDKNPGGVCKITFHQMAEGKDVQKLEWICPDPEEAVSVFGGIVDRFVIGIVGNNPIADLLENINMTMIPGGLFGFTHPENPLDPSQPIIKVKDKKKDEVS